MDPFSFAQIFDSCFFNIKIPYRIEKFHGARALNRGDLEDLMVVGIGDKAEGPRNLAAGRSLFRVIRQPAT
jgi:pSer/pThr/pTyr-binding forkhead associated (FHA) protein